MDNAFADLIPQTQANTSANPFADLIPSNDMQNDPSLQESIPKSALIGIGRGLTDAYQGVKQKALDVGEFAGVVPKGTADKYTQQVNQDSNIYNNTPVANSTSGKIGEFAGASLPYMATPLGIEKLAVGAGAKIAAPLIKRLLPSLAKSSAINAGIGALQFTPDNSLNETLFNAGMGGTLGLALPPVARGLGSANPFIKAGTGGGLGLLGASSFGDGSYKDDIAGGIIGTIAPFVPGGARALLNRSGRTALDDAAAIKILKGVDEKKALKNQDAGQRLGINLTPAEASGSPVAAKAQGKLGTSDAGAEMMQAFGQGEQKNQAAAVNNLLNTVSPDNAIASRDIRDTAKQIQSVHEDALLSHQQGKITSFLDKISPQRQNVDADLRQVANSHIDAETKALQAKAKPYYDIAMPKKIAPNKLKNLVNSDPNIGNAVEAVLNNSIYAHDLQGYAPNSIKVLDLAKRELDAQIARFNNPMSQSFDRYKAGLLTDSKHRLLAATDKFSPDYATARSIYGDGAQPLNVLQNSPVGKLANLDDSQLKNATKVIFDPAQTNMQVLGNIRDTIMKKSPNTWRNMIRNHIESKLDASSGDLGDAFQKKILGNQRDFQQLYEATKGMPDVQRELVNLRPYFQNSNQLLAGLKKTGIARIANLNDTQLKNVTKLIFDPAETDPKVLTAMRDHFERTNPEAWNKITRNYLETLVDNTNPGANFYRNALQDTRQFRQLLIATKHIPGARQKLVDMKRSFGNLINMESVQGAAGKAKSSLDVPRSTAQAVVNFAHNLVGGKYDQAQIKLITSNNWDKEFNFIKNIKSHDLRAQKFGELLSRIATVQTGQLLQNQGQNNATQ
jgi:hypothetical protein